MGDNPRYPQAKMSEASLLPLEIVLVGARVILGQKNGRVGGLYALGGENMQIFRLLLVPFLRTDTVPQQSLVAG